MIEMIVDSYFMLCYVSYAIVMLLLLVMLCFNAICAVSRKGAHSSCLLTYGANPDNRTGCGERWNRLPAAAPRFECEREQSKAKQKKIRNASERHRKKPSLGADDYDPLTPLPFRLFFPLPD
jgi:hypothetical protein